MMNDAALHETNENTKYDTTYFNNKFENGLLLQPKE